MYSLIAELDEIAASQGEQEAQHQQEIQELRLQLSRAKRSGGSPTNGKWQSLFPINNTVLITNKVILPNFET